MGNPLEEFPLDFSRPELSALRALLTQAIYRPNEIEDVVLAAGLNPGLVDFTGTAFEQWRSILKVARSHDQVPNLLEAVRELLPPLGPRIDELLRPNPVLDPALGEDNGRTDRSAADWKGFGNERLVVAGIDTLLGVAFLSLGILRSRSICRLTATFEGRAVFGTASLIGEDLLLTNHHVLHDWNSNSVPAKVVEAWFNYELDAAGATKPLTVVACDAASIIGDGTHDWAIVRTKRGVPKDAAVLDLSGAKPPRKDDYVFIIQHPEGGPKMIGLSHNLVRYVDEDVLQYWTDTKAGSSGAPVFNTRWEVVGLHHRSVDSTDDDGVAYRNQGLRIERVLEDMQALGIAISNQ